MTTPASSPGTAGTPPQPGDRRRAWVLASVIITATAIAVALRVYGLSRPGYLTGISEYDDGTDFGSAIRLVHGAIPYRDFIMVQPPGITLLMYPVALATKAAGTVTGMAVGRVVTALASAAAVPVAGLLIRHRGVFATLVTCGILAIFPDSILAARTVLLEPWLALFCLLGALAVFDGDRIAGDRRLLVGGLAFGFAGAVKVWAIIPVLVILALTARRPRQAARYAAGVALGFCATVLPFALSAPSTFYHGVIIAQLIRTDVQPIPQGYRLQQVLGLTHVNQLATPALTIIAIVAAVLIAIAFVLAARLAHSRPPALDWFAAATCALVVASFLWPADFYYHYAAFLTPFLALVIALPVSRVLAALPPDSPRRGICPGERPPGTPRGDDVAWPASRQAPSRWFAALRPAATATAALALVVLGVLQVIAESHEASGVPSSEISAAERLIPPGACVFTDQVSYTIAINRFVSPGPGCSLMVDGVGTDYALSNGRNGTNGAGSSPAVQAAWMSGFRAAKYVWLTSEAYRRISWTPQLTAYFDSSFVPMKTWGRDRLYVRAAHPQPGRLKGIPAAPPMPTTTAP